MTERILQIMGDIADFRFMDIANQLAYLNDQIELVRKYGITTHQSEL